MEDWGLTAPSESCAGLAAAVIFPVTTSCSMGGSSVPISPCFTPRIEHLRNVMMLRVSVPVYRKREVGNGQGMCTHIRTLRDCTSYTCTCKYMYMYMTFHHIYMYVMYVHQCTYMYMYIHVHVYHRIR